MRTVDNRLMVLSISTRAARDAMGRNAERAHQPGFADAYDALETIAAELETLAREGPSVDPKLEWIGENVCEIVRCREHDGVSVHWIDGDLDEHFTEGPTIGDAITKAMAEDAAGEQSTQAEAPI